MTENSTFYVHFGKLVRKYRSQSRLTQSALASLVGLSRTSISNIEKGRQKVMLHTFYDIATSLGVRPELLFSPQRPDDGQNPQSFPTNLSPGEREFIKSGLGSEEKRRR